MSTVNPVSFMAAGLVATGAIVAGYSNPSSLLAGLATSVATTFATMMALAGIARGIRRQYPLVEPQIPTSRQANLKALVRAFKELKNHPHYPLFKRIMHFKSDAEAYKYFSTELARGKCLGRTIELIHATTILPNGSSSQLFQLWNEKRVTFNQMLSCMKDNFYYKPEKLLTDSNKLITDCRERIGKISNSTSEMPDAAFFTSLRKEVDSIKEIEKLSIQLIVDAKSCNQAEDEVAQGLFPWRGEKSKVFSANDSLEIYEDNLKTLLNSPNISSKGMVIGSFDIWMPRSDTASTRSGHSIFFQCRLNQYRLHGSPSSPRGFVAFSNQQQFVNELRNTAIELCGNDFRVKFFVYKVNDRSYLNNSMIV